MVNSYDYFPCSFCRKNVLTDAIECSLCKEWSHRICAKLKKKQLEYFELTETDWYCNLCKSVFPFNEITDDELFLLNVDIEGSDDFVELNRDCRKLKYDVFEFTNYNVCDFEHDLDPEK